METKEKYALLDEGDDGVVGDGDDDDDDGVATSKRALKRKAQKKKKKTSTRAYFKCTLYGGDRITDFLEAVRALSNLLDAVVKQEVSNLPDVLRSLMQEIQSSRGQSNQ
ncbi:hypothetical protein Ddye_005118 [Dipteronia dyeriana]|uniref:Uncharacterized protein n=1 Tax=Dipteronia dyeriana TaxID=168575 RepID=A0AAE0CPB4_9ROSI|nr:hypothetical protein Ddye_005118 [Dipteronia dyeriana]